MPYLVSRQLTLFRQAGIALAALVLTGLPAHAQGSAILGQAASFGVLGGSTVTNTGPTVVYGNVGVSPGTAITGFPPGSIVGGVMHAGDAVAAQAQVDLTNAYNVLADEAPTTDLSGENLGGLTLTPGVYHFDTSAQLTGILTLDAEGDPNARFDFQIGNTLTTSTNANVDLINSAGSGNVYWQVGSEATLGTNTVFEGNLLALTSITLNTGATDLGGRALARNGAVVLNANTLGVPATTPEPSVYAFLVCLGLTSTFALRRRRRNKSEALHRN